MKYIIPLIGLLKCLLALAALLLSGCGSASRTLPITGSLTPSRSASGAIVSVIGSVNSHLQPELPNDLGDQVRQAVREAVNPAVRQSVQEGLEQMQAKIDETLSSRIPVTPPPPPPPAPAVEPAPPSTPQAEPVPSPFAAPEKIRIAVLGPTFDCAPCNRCIKAINTLERFEASKETAVPAEYVPLINRHGYPLVIFKDSAGHPRYIRRWTNEKDFERAYDHAMKHPFRPRKVSTGELVPEPADDYSVAAAGSGLSPPVAIQLPAAAIPAPRPIYRHPGGNHWTWPGDLRQHLESAHGINAMGMTPEQAMRAHDRAHEGHARAPYRSSKKPQRGVSVGVACPNCGA